MHLVSVIRKEHFMKYLCSLALNSIHFNQMWWILASTISSRIIFKSCTNTTPVSSYLVDFSSRCWQSAAVGKRATLDCRNILISLSNTLLQGKSPHAIHSSSHPLSSLVFNRFSVSCLIIWQYTSSLNGSCIQICTVNYIHSCLLLQAHVE